MINVADKSLCCGCGSCALTCPSDAITLECDEAGFIFPKVATEACIDCGLCEKKCPVLNHVNEIDNNHNLYVAYSKDSKTRFNCSSGGMFGLFAKTVICDGGIVYGAAFDDNLKLRCTEATTLKELFPLYKSKYLQSDLGNSFIKIKERLDTGNQVLFVSTPCQVYALKLFLSKDYDNLTTIDFICHGVPSQSLFDKCKAYVEKKENIKLLEYMFRAKKKNGTTPHYYKIKYQKGAKYKEKIALYMDSPFYFGFQQYITLRDSCYDCRFSHSNRVSDITIGDFHEVDKYINGINRFDGVSSVVTNTEKGNKLWYAINEDAIWHSLDFSIILNNKEFMCGGTKKPDMRDEFIFALNTQKFDFVVNKYLNGRHQFIKKLYYIMPTFLRIIIKKVLIR